MRNTVKMIKTTLIASFCIIVASCSSGGTGSIEGLNLTGTWFGTLQDEPTLAFDVTMFISQDRSVGTLIEGGNESDISYSVTFSRVNDTSNPSTVRTDCAETINNLSATITFNSNQPTMNGTEINAAVSNSQINGQAVFTDSCGGPIRLTRR